MKHLGKKDLLEWVKFNFSYRDGCLYYRWLDKEGRKVGTPDSGGYLTVSMANSTYKVHRLVYLLHHGHIPKIIDHINGNRSDNRIENLRGVDYRLNSLNSRCKKRDLPRGVYHNTNKSSPNPFRVEGFLYGKKFYLGLFPDVASASEAYEEKIKEALGGDKAPNRVEY